MKGLVLKPTISGFYKKIDLLYRMLLRMQLYFHSVSKRSTSHSTLHSTQILDLILKRTMSVDKWGSKRTISKYTYALSNRRTQRSEYTNYVPQHILN